MDIKLPLTSGIFKNLFNSADIKVTFTPPLTTEQITTLQDSASAVQLTIKDNAATVTLKDGTQLPVKLDPPQNVQNSSAQVQLQISSNRTAVIAKMPTMSQQPSNLQPQEATQIPSSTTSLPIKILSGYPSFPINTPISTTVTTPPTFNLNAPSTLPASSTPLNFQTFTALTPVTNQSTATPLPRIEIQPHTPLPLGTKVTVTVSANNTASLTQITIPPTSQRTEDVVKTATNQIISPLTSVTTPPLPATPEAASTLLISLKLMPLSTDKVPAIGQNSTFTAKVGSILPQETAQIITPKMNSTILAPSSQSLSTQHVTLPNGQSALLTSSQPLPQNTILTVTKTPEGFMPTHLTPSPQGNSTTAQQLPLPQTIMTEGGKAPLLPIPHQSFSATVTQQNTSITPPTLTVTTQSQQSFTLPQASKTPIPVGTKLTLTVLPKTTEQSLPQVQILDMVTPNLSPAQTVNTYIQKWPVLSQALNLLKASSPSQAETLKSNIPNLSQSAVTHIIPQLVGFAEAVKTSNTHKFMSDDIINILRSLGLDPTPDIQNLHQLTKPDTHEGWKGFFFPYVENDQEPPQQGSLFYRQQKQEKEDEPQTRFIVSLNLSQLGTVHLDGLYTPQQQGSTLNLRIHSSKEWPEELKQDLSDFVTQMFETLDLKGSFVMTDSPLIENPKNDFLP